MDQGYAFRVITQLKDIEHTPDLVFATSEARRELLQKVLIESESNLWKEEEEKDAAGLLADGNTLYNRGGKQGRKSATGPRRTAGNLTDLSGGQDMVYIQQNKSVNRRTKADKKAPQSDFFRAITREKERQRKS